MAAPACGSASTDDSHRLDRRLPWRPGGDSAACPTRTACGSFLAVERLRAGDPPTEACLAALRRAVEMSEDRLKTADGRPRFGLTFYAAGRGHFAVADAAGARHERPAALYGYDERP